MLTKGFLSGPSTMSCPSIIKDGYTSAKFAQKFSSVEKEKSVACSLPYTMDITSSSKVYPPIEKDSCNGANLTPSREDLISGMAHFDVTY